MKIGKALKWIFAAIFLLVLAKLVMVVFGGFHHGPRHMGFGLGGHGMRGSHHSGGPHFIWPIVSVAFWMAAIVMLVGWVKKKRGTHWFNPSVISGPLTHDTYPSYGHQADFLDEWEKNQMKQKENE